MSAKTSMKMIVRPYLALSLTLLAIAPRPALAETDKGLRDATVLIIRHAEKPESGPELTQEGEARAKAYVKYFENFSIDSTPVKLDALFATADSKNSHRPRLTLTPLSQALNLPLNLSYKDKKYADLAAELKSRPHGKNILICWHHGAIPELVGALGADPDKLIPGGKWPETQFGWLIELRYDHNGHLIEDESKRIEIKL